MSKIKVTEIAPSSSNTTSITLGTNSNVTFANGVTATSFTGDGANLTNVPAPSTFDAANLTGTLPAIDGSALTGIAAGGGLEFVKKVTVSGGQIASIVESGFDYDTVYRVVFAHLEFNFMSMPYIFPLMDNKTTNESPNINVWEYAKQVHQNYYGPIQYTGQNHWKFDQGSGYTDQYYGGYFDISTGIRPWCIGALRGRAEYGFAQLYGSKGFQANTNNDPNQTATQAKCNGFILNDAGGGWQVQNGTTYMIYKWKQS